MIIVTGGAGFIGSNIVAALDDKGVDVIISDRLRTESKWRNLASRRIRDFVFPEMLADFLKNKGENIEAIIHMGAISATTATDADEVIANNFKLSIELWQWCAQNSVKFIYASSAATYGSGEEGFIDNYNAKDLARLSPMNLYGWSKHLFDRWIAENVEHNRASPPQWVGLKFFNVYGPNEYHKGSMRSVISQLFDKLSSGEQPKLFKSYRDDYPHGGQLRDFIYVKDCVKVVDWLLENHQISGIYNVGTGKARSFEDLTLATMRSMKINDRTIEYIEMPEAICSKYQYFTEANLNNLRSAGYNARFFSLEHGIEDYVQEYLLCTNQYR